MSPTDWIFSGGVTGGKKGFGLGASGVTLATMSQNAILDALRWRYATKSFDPTKKLSEEQVGTLVESLRLTPSSFGLQTWKFLVVTDQETKDNLQKVSWNQPQVGDCSHHFVLCRPATYTPEDAVEFLDLAAETQKVPRESLEGYENMIGGFLGNMDGDARAAWMAKQVYIALGQLMAVCAVEGIDACPMEGFDATQYSAILGLEAKGLVPVVCCAIGFRAEDDHSAERAKVRFTTDQVVEFL